MVAFLCFSEIRHVCLLCYIPLIRLIVMSTQHLDIVSIKEVIQRSFCTGICYFHCQPFYLLLIQAIDARTFQLSCKFFAKLDTWFLNDIRKVVSSSAVLKFFSIQIRTLRTVKVCLVRWLMFELLLIELLTLTQPLVAWIQLITVLIAQTQ